MKIQKILKYNIENLRENYEILFGNQRKVI